MEGSMDVVAAAANCRCSRVVYVGNIPFDATEEEARDACELIGPVLSFRLAADGATGKRKGYAFVEYADDETARSACRNLSGHTLRGRQLRVGLGDRKRRRRGDHEPVGMEDAIHAASLLSGRPPVASLTRYLAGLSRNQLREAMAEFESQGPEALKKKALGLAAAMEQVQHLLDMAAADDAANEAKKKRTASACTPPVADETPDQPVKMRKVEDGREAMIRARLACM